MLSNHELSVRFFLASLDHSWSVAAIAISGGAAYAVVLLTMGRRWLTRLGQQVERQGKLTHPLLAITLMLTLLGAWFTDAIRIYAVFGPFVLGVAMPRGRLALFAIRVLMTILTTLMATPRFEWSCGRDARASGQLGQTALD